MHGDCKLITWEDPPAPPDPGVAWAELQAQINAGVAAWINDHLPGALRTYLGLSDFATDLSSLRQHQSPIAGSVFYPLRPAGIMPVVGATIEIYRCDLSGFLSATGLDDFIDTGHLAGTAPTKTDYQGRFVVEIEFQPFDFLFVARVSKNQHVLICPVFYNGLTHEFLPVIVGNNWLEDAHFVENYRRPNLNSRTDVGQLADELMRVVDVELVKLHMLQIDHIENLFIDHKHYIWQVEKRLLKNPAMKHHVPLPQWQPVNPIPDAMPDQGGRQGSFFQVVDLGDDFDRWGVNGIITPFYNHLRDWMRPMIPQALHPDSFDNFNTAMELAQYIGRSAASGRTSFHFTAHAALGGPFASMMTAASATIFWPVHALLVDVYDHWLKIQLKGTRKYCLGNRILKKIKPHAHDDPSHPQPHEEVTKSYIEIFAISSQKELWRVYERDVVYMRDDRPFDPQFDPAEILGCSEPAWIHFNQWENLSVKKINPMLLHPTEGEDNEKPKTVGSSGGSGKGHSHGGLKPIATPVPTSLADLVKRKRKKLPDAHEIETEVLIDCEMVDMKTTTDLLTGRVIILAREESGELCLLRPAGTDCNKCNEAVFRCKHLDIHCIAYDFVMKDDNTLVIMYVDANGQFIVVQETGYRSNHFAEVDGFSGGKKIPHARHAQVKSVKDDRGRVHAFICNYPEITQPTGTGPLNFPHEAHPEGSLFHFFEKQGGGWDHGGEPFSDKCPCNYAVVKDANNVIWVVAVDCEDRQIWFRQVAADDARDATEWKLIEHRSEFFYLAIAVNSSQEIELFAINSSGDIFRNKTAGLSRWTQWKRMDQIEIMGKNHKAIFAQRDYEDTVKVFVHAVDHFIYMAEQQQEEDEYLGWLNI